MCSKEEARRELERRVDERPAAMQSAADFVRSEVGVGPARVMIAPSFASSAPEYLSDILNRDGSPKPPWKDLL